MAPPPGGFIQTQPMSDISFTGNRIKVTTSAGDCVVVHESNGLGLPIVFLHDVLLSAEQQFADVLQGRLGRQHRVLCIDFPGHGTSSPALYPTSTYSISGFTSVVKEVVKHLGLRNAIFVGSGLGAYILASAAPELSCANGFVFCDLATHGSDAAATSIGNSWWIEPADALQVKLNALSAPVGIVACTVMVDLIALLNPRKLWRNAVQVVPGVSSHVSTEQPEVFCNLIRAFAADVVVPPETEESPFLHAPTVAPTHKEPSRQKHPPGTMPNAMARYEPFDVDTSSYGVGVGGGTNAYQPGTTSNQANPHRRGRIPPGTMPNPAARFEAPSDEQEPIDHGPAQRSVPHANVRGRVEPGTMPHPGARFELPVEDHSVVTNTSKLAQRKNPNNRGRIVGGTMPHPSARFESTGDEDDQGQPHAGLQAQTAPPNPLFARGRKIPGTMPHPALRFHADVDVAPAAVTGSNVPSTKVMQPPGGRSTFILG